MLQNLCKGKNKAIVAYKGKDTTSDVMHTQKLVSPVSAKRELVAPNCKILRTTSSLSSGGLSAFVTEISKTTGEAGALEEDTESAVTNPFERRVARTSST